MDDESLQDCIQLLVQVDAHLASDPADLVHAARLAFVIEGLCDKYGVDCPRLDRSDEDSDVDPTAPDSIGPIGSPGAHS